MKRVALPLLLGLVLGLTACNGSGEAPFDSSTAARSKERLREPKRIEGILCRSYAHYHEDGGLLGSQLAEDHTLAGHPLPEDTWFWLSDEGALETVWLPRDAEVAGMLCRGGGKISVGFHPDGSLSSVFLTEDTEVQGIPCEASVFAPVRFHPNGRIRECRLSSDHVVGGVRVRPGETLRLDPEGLLVEG